MRNFLIGTEAFEKKRQSALASVRSQFERSLPDRKNYYIEIMAPKVEPLKKLVVFIQEIDLLSPTSDTVASIEQALSNCLPDEKFAPDTKDDANFKQAINQLLARLLHEIETYKQQCIGGIKSLADESVEKLVESPYLTATDRQQLIIDLNKVWFELVAAISNDPLFIVESDAAITCYEETTTQSIIERIIKYEYHYAANLCYLNPKHFSSIMDLPHDSKLKLAACRLILKYIYQQERMKPHCEEKTYPLKMRKLMLTYLNKHNPEDNRINWFEADGTTSPYPTWWARKASLRSIWNRIISVEIELTTSKEYDYRLPLADKHYGLVIDTLGEIADSTIHNDQGRLIHSALTDFDSESLLKLSRFVVINLEEFISLSKRKVKITDYQAQHIAILLTILKHLNHHCIMNDIDNPNLSCLMQLQAYLKKNGEFAWPDNYTQHNVAAYEVWHREFGDCGYTTIEQFMVGNDDLVAPLLDRRRYLKWAEEEYTGPDESTIKLRELEIRAKAAMLRLKAPNKVSDIVIRSNYMTIVTSYAQLTGEAEYVNFIEQHNGDGKSDQGIIEVWISEVARSAGYPQRFYLSSRASDILTMTAFIYNSHTMKAFIAEAIINRLEYSLKKQREEDRAAYSNAQLGVYFHILRKFLTTNFTMPTYEGINISELKYRSHELCLQKLPGDDHSFDLLDAKSSVLIRRHHKNYYQSYQTPYWDNLLTVHSYRKSSEKAQIEIVQACRARFNITKETYEPSQTSGANLKFIRDILTEHLTKNLLRSSPLLDDIKTILLQLDEHGLYRPNGSSMMAKKINEIKSYRRALMCCNGSLDASYIQQIFINVYLASFNRYYHMLQPTVDFEPEIDTHLSTMQPIVNHLKEHYPPEIIDKWMLESRLTLLDSICSQYDSAEDFFEDGTVIDIYCELYELRHDIDDERLHSYLYQQARYLSDKSMKQFESEKPHSKMCDTPSPAGLISACVLFEYWNRPSHKLDTVANLKLLPPLLRDALPQNYKDFKRSLDCIRQADVKGFKAYFIDICICPVKLGFINTLSSIKATTEKNYKTFLQDAAKILKVDHPVIPAVQTTTSPSHGCRFMLWAKKTTETQQPPSSPTAIPVHS